jgi:ABC-type transporter Mla subunit MlaD
MTRNTHYYKVGLYAIIAIIVLIILILSLGANRIFEPKFYIETYFNQSISGLYDGSPVKFQGITVGHVNKIEMLSQEYNRSAVHNNKIFNRYVYVQMAITHKQFQNISHNILKHDLQRQVKQGLRIKLTSTGLTGTSYLELTFVNPNKNKPLAVTWEPKHLYIPSARNDLTKLSDGLENMIGNMQSIDFKKLSHNLTKLTSNLDNSIQQADVKGLSKDMKSSLITLKDTALQYQTVAKNINQLFSNKELKGTLSNIASITKQLKSTGSEAQRSLKLLNKTLNNTNALIREYKAHANQILSNTESMTENMRAFSETAKQYPRQILFGSPPPHIDPSKL